MSERAWNIVLFAMAALIMVLAWLGFLPGR